MRVRHHIKLSLTVVGVDIGVLLGVLVGVDVGVFNSGKSQTAKCELGLSKERLQAKLKVQDRSVYAKQIYHSH